MAAVIEAPTLWELVVRRSDATPGARILVDEQGRAMTFAQCRDAAERAAAGLAKMGVLDGTVVSWQLPTWIESVVLTAALARLGAVQNPIIPIYREREVGFIVRQARTRLLIVPTTFRSFDFEAMAHKLAEEIPELHVLVTDRALPDGDPSTLPVPAAHDTTKWLFYTSGTTAEPKGAQHTDGSIMAAARGMSERLKLTADDRSGVVFPFTHIAGPIWLASALMTGCSVLIDAAFDPATTIPFLRREGVTLAGSGTIFHMAYLRTQREHPGERLFPHNRAFPGGGAPKPPQLHVDIRKAMGGAGIVSGYGLTEAPILTMASVDDPDEALAHTEGRATTGVELRIVTLEGSVALAGEEGEVRAKGPQVMRGYLDASLDTHAFDADGFFRTGDLGRLDADSNLIITGRVKDVIIRKGENISAKEVEDLLFAHPKVADTAVVGLPHPESGELCCAVVVLKDGGDPLRFAEMAEFLKGRGLRTQAVPERLEIVDALPRNPAGKVLKFELRERYAPAQR